MRSTAKRERVSSEERLNTNLTQQIEPDSDTLQLRVGSRLIALKRQPLKME